MLYDTNVLLVSLPFEKIMLSTKYLDVTQIAFEKVDGRVPHVTTLQHDKMQRKNYC